MKVEPDKCWCGGEVEILPKSGGRGSGDLTSYDAVCRTCDMCCEHLGINDGTKRTATRDWNRVRRTETREQAVAKNEPPPGPWHY